MSVRFITANTNFATGNKRDRPALRRLTGLPVKLARALRRKRVPAPDPPEILFLQEAKTGRARKLLLGLFRGKQGKGPARSGTALLSRGIQLRGLRLWLGGRSSATLPRWVTEGWISINGHRIYCLSVHIFPKRAGRAAQLRYVTKLRRRLAAIEEAGDVWVVGCDANLKLADFARMLCGRAYGHGITGFVVHPRVKVSASGTSRIGLRTGAFDHPSHWIEIEGVR